MSKKSTIIWIIIVIVVGVGAFFGGSAYGNGQAAAARSSFAAGGASGRGTFAGRGGAGGALAAGAGATSGTILSATGSSLTIQLRTGSTQIVFLGTSTPIMQEVAGSVSDLAPGDQITVIGTANSDGSLTASSIQLRPATTSPTSSTSQ